MSEYETVAWTDEGSDKVTVQVPALPPTETDNPLGPFRDPWSPGHATARVRSDAPDQSAVAVTPPPVVTGYWAEILSGYSRLPGKVSVPFADAATVVGVVVAGGTVPVAGVGTVDEGAEAGVTGAVVAAEPPAPVGSPLDPVARATS